tara:strand:- start:223 stop:1047 length:825 start_codon:yes stop_codon:yes gene_type:complete
MDETRDIEGTESFPGFDESGYTSDNAEAASPTGESADVSTDSMDAAAQNNVEKLEKDVDALNTGVDSLNTGVKALEQQIEGLKKDIETISGDIEHELHTETHAPAESHDMGMPQLNPEWFPSQLFWLTACFIVLYLFMSRLIIPKIQNVLEYRSSRIEQDLNRADNLKAEAEDVQQGYEKAMIEARDNATSTIADAQSAIDTKMADEFAALDAKLAKKMAEAESSIAKAKQAAYKEVAPVATELAGTIVEQLVHVKPAADKLDSAVSAHMKKQG